MDRAVTTFAVEAAAIRAVATHEDMAAASASLPPGAYSSLRTYGGRRVLRLGQHVRRLLDSATLLGRPGHLEEEAVRAAVRSALAASGHEESRLRLTFAPPQLFVSVERFRPLPASLYARGALCVTVPERRDQPQSKDTRFIAAAAAAYARLPPGIQEGIMQAQDGALLEGLSSNFFAVTGGRLHTEERRVLAGVTRSLVLELAAARMPVALTAVTLPQLMQGAECFITSVSREVLPVVRIDELAVGNGQPGPRTRELMQAFAAMVEREAEVL